jgi:heme/copper-type cytochrome/quinol oxidase subunit 3
MQNKIMMRLVVGSEVMFFIALIISYLFFWRSGHFQKEVAEHLDIKLTGIFTVFLLGSSFTFWMAERSYKKGKATGMKIWLSATILLGLIFLAGQGHEYYNLIQENLTISKSEFGSSFYALTGFHGLHVFIGLIILTIILILAMKGLFKNGTSSVISTVGIYWHFVDAVWVIVFTVVYVLPYIL